MPKGTPSPTRVAGRGRRRVSTPRYARSATDQQINTLINARIRGGVGKTVITNPYEESGAIYRLVNVVAGALVDGDLGVWRRSKQKDVPDPREESGEAVDLIEHPMGIEDPRGDGDQIILTKNDFLFVIAAIAMLCRSADVLVQPGRITDKPVRLLPLPPNSVRPMRAQSDPWRIIGWEARVENQTFRLRPKDIIRFRFAPDPMNLLSGVGPAIPAQTSVDTREAALRYNKHALENGGSLGGILQFEEDVMLDDPTVAEIRRRFSERHFGPENAERLAVLSGKFKWIDTGKSARDMQFSTVVDKSLEDMARPFGVPLLFLGVADHSALSRATVLVEKANLYHNSLLQVAKRFAEQFTRVVRRIDPDLYCWWDFSRVDALKQDETERMQQAKLLLDMGFYLSDVAKKYEFDVALPRHADKRLVPAGLVDEDAAYDGSVPGMEGGDSSPQDEPALETPRAVDLAHVTAATDIVAKVKAGDIPRDSGVALLKLMGLDDQQAQQIIGSAGEERQSVSQPQPPAPESAPEPETEERAQKVKTKAQIAYLLSDDSPLTDEQKMKLKEEIESGVVTVRHARARIDVRARAWRAYVNKVQPYENAIRGAWRKELNRQRAVVIAAVRSASRSFKRDDTQARRIVDAFDVEALIDALSSAIEKAFIAGANQVGRELSDMGLANDVMLQAEKGRLPKLAESYFDKRSGVLKNKTAQRIKTELHETILEGLNNNEGIEQIVDRVRDVFKGELQESQVRRIAVTEAHTAVSHGRVELMKSQGVKKHEWLSARDAHVRESHQAVDGEVVEIGAQFSNGCRYPGDPDAPPEETVNCRCVAIPVDDALERFADETERVAHLDSLESELCVLYPAEDLARRALHLGITDVPRAVARAIPKVLAEDAKSSGDDAKPIELLRKKLPELQGNPAVSGAVRQIGVSVFAALWIETIEGIAA